MKLGRKIRYDHGVAIFQGHLPIFTLINFDTLGCINVIKDRIQEQIQEHRHKWKIEDIREPNFGVCFGKMRSCECGTIQVSDYCGEDRGGSPWRLVRHAGKYSGTVA